MKMKVFCIGCALLANLSLCGADATTALVARDTLYRLQPSDVIEIHYRYTPEYDQTVSLQPDGYVSLNLLGSIKLSALTLDEAQTALTTKAASRLREPEISLVLKDFDKPHFVVAGEVANPGKFDLRGRVSAVQAIAMAGGFKTASAKHSQVILFRRAGGDTAQTRILDIKAIMRPAGLREDVDLLPGDMLIVPQNQISKIERFVHWGNIGMFLNPGI